MSILKQHNLLSYFLGSGTLKTPTVNLLRMNPERNQNCFLTPKRYDKQPRPFYIGFPNGMKYKTRDLEDRWHELASNWKMNCGKEGPRNRKTK